MIIEFLRVLILQLLLTFRFVADAPTLKDGYISKDLNYLPFFINPAWAEKNRTAVVKFIKAHIQALRWTYDHQAETVEFLKKNSAWHRNMVGAASSIIRRIKFILTTVT